VTRDVRVGVVVGELEPRHEQEVVQLPRALGLDADRVQVLAVALRGDPGPLGVLGGPGIVGPQRVIGDDEDVETARAVEIDELRQRKRPRSRWCGSATRRAAAVPSRSCPRLSSVIEASVHSVRRSLGRLGNEMETIR